MDSVVVDARVSKRHPKIKDSDVLSAWGNAISVIRRDTSEKDFFVVIGSDSKGRLIEMVAAEEVSGTKRIFHAMTPPSEISLKELGLVR